MTIDKNTGLVLEGGGLRGVFTCGVLDCFMDFKLLIEDFPERIIPYDYDAYFANPDRFVMVTTNCLTGNAEYFEEKSSSKRVMDIVRASSSLPFVSPIAYVDGVPMLDGGIADSVPVEYAINQGYEKLVVVLTRNKGYRKKDAKMRAAKVVYHGYSNLSMPGSYGKGYGKAHCIVSGRL